MIDGLYRIVAPHFVCGVTVHDGKVGRAAPIMRWAENRYAADVFTEARQKGWRVSSVDRDVRSPRP